MKAIQTNLEVEDHECDRLEGVRGVSGGEAHTRLLHLVGRPPAVAAEQVQVSLRGCHDCTFKCESRFGRRSRSQRKDL